jgi:predicted transcriptional regulator
VNGIRLFGVFPPGICPTKPRDEHAAAAPGADEVVMVTVWRVACFLIFAYSHHMELHLTPEQQAQLKQLAHKSGTIPDELATRVVARYLDEEARFLAAVQKGIDAAERGEFVEEEEMDARLEAMFKS